MRQESIGTNVAKLLGYKEKKEIRLRPFKLKDKTYLFREDFSKETVEIRKKLWDKIQKLREDGKYAVIKYDKIIMKDFRPRRQYVFSGVMVLFFKLITILLFKMNAPKNDLQKLKFDPFLFAEYTLKQKLRFR